MFNNGQLLFTASVGWCGLSFSVVGCSFNLWLLHQTKACSLWCCWSRVGRTERRTSLVSGQHRFKNITRNTWCAVVSQVVQLELLDNVVANVGLLWSEARSRVRSVFARLGLLDTEVVTTLEFVWSFFKVTRLECSLDLLEHGWSEFDEFVELLLIVLDWRVDDQDLTNVGLLAIELFAKNFVVVRRLFVVVVLRQCANWAFFAIHLQARNGFAFAIDRQGVGEVFNQEAHWVFFVEVREESNGRNCVSFCFPEGEELLPVCIATTVVGGFGLELIGQFCESALCHFVFPSFKVKKISKLVDSFVDSLFIENHTSKSGFSIANLKISESVFISRFDRVIVTRGA